jgi:hypothetical protein
MGHCPYVTRENFSDSIHEIVIPDSSKIVLSDINLNCYHHIVSFTLLYPFIWA